jgi:hypothetical protein
MFIGILFGMDVDGFGFFFPFFILRLFLLIPFVLFTQKMVIFAATPFLGSIRQIEMTAPPILFE